MPFTNSKRTFKIRLISIAALAAAIYLLILFAGYPQAVECYFSEGAYPIISTVLHPVLNIFPFSVGDIIYILAIGHLAYALIIFIKRLLKKDFLTAGFRVLKLIIKVQIAILVFYLFWGMNYFRPPAGERLNLRDTSYTTDKLKAVTAMLIDSANATRARLTVHDMKQENDSIYKTAIRAVCKLSSDSVGFRTYHPDIKSSLLTPLLNFIGTSGYFNPFTGEAQINYQMPVFNRPVVACHEMSHQMGYGPEDEADFAGFLAGINSNDKLLRYSAYHMAVDEFMHALYYRDSLENKKLRPRVSKAVHQDFVDERKYWMTYQGKLNVITGIFYDHYLKVNNQPQGLDTYNRMILLVMAKYGRSL
ncbi:DUF3810 domain-containing protein [Mucilaginibacter sp. L3T2-6]|uniref:DUF3810 domain-containing protein n=1 Tax=Mucilaginibacter sp. L3T2-6 TaxID=3062491 RepID=UPI002675BCD2|nr:DUF3810 domain-containing protein [Mucilaginibacter sp. L3T2-6]MDO3640585.1 DUF3810 domain-containing protein [Mucilaginibacter sp. L3T2-6]MDV6213076.1 DUF3810 domain-containing protein [Mucilaginibacter sp. L3T2-6]